MMTTHNPTNPDARTVPIFVRVTRAEADAINAAAHAAWSPVSKWVRKILMKYISDSASAASNRELFAAVRTSTTRAINALAEKQAAKRRAQIKRAQQKYAAKLKGVGGRKSPVRSGATRTKRTAKPKRRKR